MFRDPPATRAAFDDVAEAFVDLVRAVPADGWDRHSGCGTWTIRELVAHTARSFSLIETYLAVEPTTDRLIADAVEYYQVALADPHVHAGVAARGREEAANLSDPLGQVEVLAARVIGRVASTGDDDPIHTRVGTMAFGDYLSTRVVEFALHNVDLQRALGKPVEINPTAAEVILSVLTALGPATMIILALTGRTTLPDEFNVLG